MDDDKEKNTDVQPAEGQAEKSTEEAAKEKKGPGVKFGIRIKFSLAILALVSVIIMTITGYFIRRESQLLKEQIFQSIEREIIHLSNTAQNSIGVDELALVEAINNLKKITYINYAYILNKDNMIIQNFDKRKSFKTNEVLNDSVERSKNKGNEAGIIITDYPDPKDKDGVIYDFSKPVINKLNKKKIGTVIIGLSDIIIREEVANMVRIIIFISLIFLAISIVGTVILTSIIIKPIKKLSHGATVIGTGDLDYKIDIKSSDELGKLANEFNQMTAMIKEAKNKEIESRLMEEQLEMAKDIQEGLNPMGYYDKGGIQIKGFTRAAKGVGGDYFDYIDIDEDRVGALISDVSGKGVPASLVMVMIRTVFTSYISRKDVDCASVVKAINDSLSADFAIDKFATLFFLIYNRKTQELAFSNAGHGPLFLYRASLDACSNTMLEGVPIGIMEDIDYNQAKVKLNPGDMVVMYTDGVTEMRNAAKEEFGIKRVQELMMNHHDLNAKEFVDLLVDEVDKFKGDEPPHDDETALVVKRDS
ncbi:SpoIIE family protein phosphatase [Spirochaetota bacterium]